MSTIGDDQELECPWCEKNICLQDAHTDGCLEEGWVDTCPTCEKPFKITGVDYSITVWADRTEEKP